MNSDQLDFMPAEDNVVIQLEQFKNGLIAKSRGESFEEKEYNRLRKIVLGLPGAESLIPKFLKICRTGEDFWQWIKNEAKTYADRRTLITEALNPILEFVEYESGEGALEFKRNYEEIKVIGEGGFGLVYQYEHRMLKMPFAVKVFAPSFYKGGNTELERFFQEARMLFKLHHPSIIKVYDAGLIGSRPFIRMEYFAGRNLNEILKQVGRVTPAHALRLIYNITDALRHAHEDVGIIHRDLKPSNIMAAQPNQFRVIDFGLGIFIENELHSRLTKVGEAVISGYYNAPELVENPKLVDKRSDIYSLGAVWFTMLTGQPPAGTSFMEQLKEIDGMTSEYLKCIEECLYPLVSRTSSCNILLKQIEDLKVK